MLTVLTALCAVASPAAAGLAAPTPAAAGAAGLTRWQSAPGTAWWTDPTDGRPTVGVDDTVRPDAVAHLATALRRAGGHLVREPGTRERRIAGGDAVYGAVGGRCSIGFNARALPTYYFLTSAHCVGTLASTVYADAAHTVALGVVSTSSPNYDFALVRYTDTRIAKPSAVDLYTGALQPITGFGSGYIGQPVRRSGPSGVRSGVITALNVTVNYADGAVYGLIRTNICSEPGDSGGPLFAGSIGIGITSGGSGSCGSGGISYFASAGRAATTYGVAAYWPVATH
jgi:S1-C subfamily serine protease